MYGGFCVVCWAGKRPKHKQKGAPHNEQPVTIIMANGFQMRGTIIGADQFTILVESGGKRQLVYKSALSTIVGEAGA